MNECMDYCCCFRYWYQLICVHVFGIIVFFSCAFVAVEIFYFILCFLNWSLKCAHHTTFFPPSRTCNLFDFNVLNHFLLYCLLAIFNNIQRKKKCAHNKLNKQIICLGRVCVSTQYTCGRIVIKTQIQSSNKHKIEYWTAATNNRHKPSK